MPRESERLGACERNTTMDSEMDSMMLENDLGIAQNGAGGKDSGNDALWKEIDYSETCLVSSMFQEAIEAATSCLRDISIRVTNEGVWVSDARKIGSEEVDEELGELFSMMEASGMVLLQALNGLGRSSEIFDVLTSIFNSFSKVPHSLFLTGICLQISAALHGSAKNALEEYLSGWKSAEKGSDGLLTKLVPPNGHCQRVVREIGPAPSYAHLTRTEYLQLTEIYVIEVLVIGLRNPKAAMLWIRQANISEDNKGAIIDKMQKIVQHERAKGKRKEQSSENYCDSTSGPVARPSQRAREQTNGATHSERDSPGADQAAEVAPKEQSSPKGAGPSNSRAVSRGSTFCHRFPFVRTVCRLIELVMVHIRAHFSPHSEILPEGKLILTGAFTSILLIALLRNRRRLFRLLATMVNPVKTALRDVWQQAFSVQLYPLAAAQPLPTARALVA